MPNEVGNLCKVGRSAGAMGGKPSDYTGRPVILAEDRFFAFDSRASNLVPGRQH